MPTQRKIPRGAGYDKRSISRHLKALEAFDGTVIQYARKAKLNANTLVVACEEYFPERWLHYVELHPLDESVCGYCSKTFIANRVGMEYCSDKCSRDARTDRDYFGGKRREAVGMVEGVCQLCKQSPKKGLTPHHLIGKENDPENEHMIALCLGCHELVTLAARRIFLRKNEGWEHLRWLADTRARGALDPWR